MSGIIGDELFSGLGELQDFASDALAAWESRFSNIQADEIVAADIADFVGLVVPQAALAGRLLRVLAALTPALEQIHVQGGVNANFGPGNGDPLGIQTGR